MQLTVHFRRYFCVVLYLAALPHCVRAEAGAASLPAARYHCAGTVELAGETNLETLHKAFALPSAPAVEKIVLAKFSWLLAGTLRFGTNASTVALIKPLLSDVMEQESAGSFGDSAGHFLLAVHINAKRAQVWQNNLAKVLGAPSEKFSTEGLEGARWNRAGAGSIWILPAEDWLLAGCGDEFLPLQAEYLRSLKSQGRPVPALLDHWLEADLDSTRPNAWLPGVVSLFKPARVQITVAPEDHNLRLAARVTYSEAVPWTSKPWRVPTNLIQSPFISFTAGQDVAAYLDLGPNFSRLDGNPLTNQFYAWAMPQMTFQSYMAWPEEKATNVLEKLGPEATNAFNPFLKQFNGTQLDWLAPQKRLLLANLRVIWPALTPAKDPAGEFLFLSLFQRSPVSKPPPGELLKQVVGRDNLVYYDWEMTGLRLHDWRMLGLMLLSRWHDSTDEEDMARLAEEKWLGDLTPLAGNTVTEITRVAPNELSVVRNAPVGFTGIEMFLLSNWLAMVGNPPVSSSPPPH
jgi:hypothetical protein